VYTKEYHTVSHSDAMLSAGFYGDKGFGLNTDFLLFTIGALQVRGLLELTYDVGALEAATQDVPDDRVLFGFPPPFPQAARTGRRYVNPLSGTQYHDGAWALAAHECAESFVGTELPPDDPQVIAKVKEAVSGLIGVSACDAKCDAHPRVTNHSDDHADDSALGDAGTDLQTVARCHRAR
jgi:hypothetical protein